MGTKNDDKCRRCMWFNPAYDKCIFYGAVRVDDVACEDFQSVE